MGCERFQPSEGLVQYLSVPAPFEFGDPLRERNPKYGDARLGHQARMRSLLRRPRWRCVSGNTGWRRAQAIGKAMCSQPCSTERRWTHWQATRVAT